MQLNTEALKEPRAQMRAYLDLLEQVTERRRACASRGGRIEWDAVAQMVERGLVRATARALLEEKQ